MVQKKGHGNKNATSKTFKIIDLYNIIYMWD